LELGVAHSVVRAAGLTPFLEHVLDLADIAIDLVDSLDLPIDLVDSTVVLQVLLQSATRSDFAAADLVNHIALEAGVVDSAVRGAGLGILCSIMADRAVDSMVHFADAEVLDNGIGLDLAAPDSTMLYLSDVLSAVLRHSFILHAAVLVNMAYSGGRDATDLESSSAVLGSANLVGLEGSKGTALSEVALAGRAVGRLARAESARRAAGTEASEARSQNKTIVS
jgi:hypothetical protein